MQRKGDFTPNLTNVVFTNFGKIYLRGIIYLVMNYNDALQFTAKK